MPMFDSSRFNSCTEHMKILSGQDEDKRRFLIEAGDPGFSPDRNEDTINRTIAIHEANVKRREKEYADQLGERVDAVATYLKHLSHSHNTTPAEKYFGKKNLAALQGRKIKQRLIDASKGVYRLEELS